MNLTTLTSPTPADAGYALDVPAGWRQGRGAYGGFTIASLLRAIEHRVGDPARTLRSLTAELLAPVATGPATVLVHVLRAGSSVTTARAELVQDGEIRAHVVAMLARSRGGAPLAWQTLQPPVAPPWRDVQALPPAAAGGPFPEFAQHFEYRLVDGMPFTGGAARTVGWVRARDPGPARDAAYLAALADVWWPAPLVALSAPRPIATIAFTLDVLGDLAGVDAAAPLLYRGTAPVCSDGYFLETRELWTPDGRLVAYNQQTFAVIA